MTSIYKAFHVLAAVLGLAACSHGSQEPIKVSYVTEYGLGPDKWATAWLLTQRPGASGTLRIAAPNAEIAGDQGVLFDAPGASIRRIGDRAAFEVALRELAITDPDIAYLGEIVHEIEVNFWASEGPPEAQIVEDAYRDLQRRHGRDRVTADCYVAFFDRVYSVMRSSRARGAPVHADQLMLDCEELVEMADARDTLVPETPIADVLGAMASGRRVVFVDVREPDEFAEAHIPGALNITLREVSPQIAQRLAGADYVVSYCVKDFRGFEMAKALANVGVANSVIMRPYGVKGWAQLGLPLTGSGALTEEAAREDLAKCLAAHGECLSTRRRARELST